MLLPRDSVVDYQSSACSWCTSDSDSVVVVIFFLSVVCIGYASLRFDHSFSITITWFDDFFDNGKSAINFQFLFLLKINNNITTIFWWDWIHVNKLRSWYLRNSNFQNFRPFLIGKNGLFFRWKSPSSIITTVSEKITSTLSSTVEQSNNRKIREGIPPSCSFCYSRSDWKYYPCVLLCCPRCN